MLYSLVLDVYGFYNLVFGFVVFNGFIIDCEGVQLLIIGIGVMVFDCYQKLIGKVQYKGGYLQS